MKPEFTQVCLSETKGSSGHPYRIPPPLVIRTLSTSGNFWSLVLLFVVVFVGFGLIVWRYDTQLALQETRILVLEGDMSEILKKLEGYKEQSTGNKVNVQEFVVPIHSGRSDDDTVTGTVTVDGHDGSYYDDEEDEVLLGHALMRDESDEGMDDLEDEAEVEEIVFGRVNNAAKRQKREAHGSSERLSIVDGAYGGTDRETTTDSEGLRLYESLLTTGGQGEPKAPEFAESEGSNVQAYHRNSAAWAEDTTGRSRSRLEVKAGDNPLYHRSTSPYSQHYSGAIASRRSTSSLSPDTEVEQMPSVIVRHSRVPVTGDSRRRIQSSAERLRSTTYPYPPLRKIGQGDGEVIARVHQDRVDDDESDPDEATAGADHGESSSFAISRSTRGGASSDRDQRRIPNRPHRKGQLNHDAEELNILQAEAWAEGPKTIAAHFVADSSNYSLTHRHYEGNGRLRNADGIYASWRPASWMAESDNSRDFILSPTGVVTLKKEGLYWVYAQVHYLDSHDINGFALQVNTESLLTCTRMTETAPGSTPKSNSCFTAGIHHFKENDRILIRDIETNRFSIIKPEKTFFGLMRIGELRKR